MVSETSLCLLGCRLDVLGQTGVRSVSVEKAVVFFQPVGGHSRPKGSIPYPLAELVHVVNGGRLWVKPPTPVRELCQYPVLDYPQSSPLPDHCSFLTLCRAGANLWTSEQAA